MMKSNTGKSGKAYFPRLMEECIVAFSSFVMAWYFSFILKGDIEGSENLLNKPYVLALNHVSYLDWLIVYAVFFRRYGVRIRFPAKAKLLRNPFWNVLLKSTRTIIVDHRSMGSVKNIYRTLSSCLGTGNVVGIFPEGTRSSTGKLQAAKGGAAHILLQADVPLVPVGLIGFYEAWPRHKKIPGIAKGTIRIGKPLQFRKDDCAERKRAKHAVTNIIMHEIANLTGDTYDYAIPIRHEVMDTLRFNPMVYGV